MSKSFIDEVRSIVISNISDEQFGVRELSNLLKLSSSQTLRKVKTATGKSVNQYIRELRLEKAAKLIRKTDYTAAEISYQVGFGSPTYFNNAFRKYYGITPGEYKAKNISLNELATQKKKSKPQLDFTSKKLHSTVSILLLFIIGYFLINKYTQKNKVLTNSIAVLPFKDLSPENTQWFCDGVSDNVLHSFAQLKNLSVTSFTSSSTYRNTNKQIPEIAKELGVSYILEGSVTLYEDKIKIITQLINANDEHIWSHEYNESFENIIAIQNNVAQEVVKQLKITLSPKEETTLKQYPTKNMEAYNLFLKGRLVNNSRKLKDLTKNIELNKQAIDLDPNYAEAYAEISQSYYILGRSTSFDDVEVRDSANYYANKALKLNPNTYRAWAVKANLMHYKDWDKAKEYYKKAISLNPNDALTHIQYAKYFLYRPNPNIKKYLDELRIAQKLNPLSNIIGSDYLRALTINNKLDEAEDYLEKMGFLLSDKSKINHRSRIIAYRKKDWTAIIPFLETQVEENSNNSSYYSMLGDAYDGILNDDLAALSYYKKAYEIDSTKTSNVVTYLWLLVESEKFKEAKKLLQSENFISVISKRRQLMLSWYYYYHLGNTKKTLELVKDSLLTNQYTLQVWTYAQLGDRKKVDSISKTLYWAMGSDRYWRTWKAFTHAILKDKDSMYYYLEAARYDGTMRIYPNSRREFDPYRNEERFKAILRDNYLPVPEE